jgi:streptogramin lyase
VIVDGDGGVWFSHFGEQFLSKLDPVTGKVTDFPIPVLKPDHPKGTLDLEVDADGYIWVGMMYQGGMARFDRKTEQFRTYPVPKEWQTDATQQSHFSVAGMKVDGKVWVKNSDRSQVMKLDPVTGQYENLGSFKIPSSGRPIGIYGIYADQQNNAYILEFGNGGIGKIDAKTGAMAFYPTPTPFSRARRGRVDHENRLCQRSVRPRRPARSQDRRVDQLSHAALLELPPRVRRRSANSGDGLDRQQSRGFGDEGRTAGLADRAPAASFTARTSTSPVWRRPTTS